MTKAIAAAVVGQLLLSFGASFQGEGSSDTQHLSPSPSVLLKFTWNHQQYNNGSCLLHHVWQHKIKYCYDSTLPHQMSQPDANRTTAIAMASPSPPFWPCCWQNRDSPVWAPLQGIRGTSFHTKAENLFILAPHCHTWENTSDERCDSWPDGSEAGFLHDHRTDHSSRLCDGPKVAFMHQSLEAKETTDCDNHIF